MGMKRRQRDAIGMLDRSHARLTERMEQLAGAVTAIAAGTATDDDRETLDEVMEYLNGAAARHVDDEEQSVFPRLAAHPRTRPLVKRLKAEHRNHDDTLAALRGAVRHLPAGAGTVATIAADLAAQYRDHIELEDAELIPAVRELLTAEQLDDIRTEMRARRGK